MVKKLKKLLVSTALLVTVSVPTVAYAASHSESFSYGSISAKGTLTGVWSLNSYDKGKAITEMAKATSGYVVTAYIEVQKSAGGAASGAKFDFDNTYVEVNQNDFKGVWRFNSSHSIASDSNVTVAKNNIHLTDW